VGRYIWELEQWPQLGWDSETLLSPLAAARLAQGRLMGRTSGLGLAIMRDVHAAVLTEETVRTAAIEGEILSRESVRSSVARRLGLPTAGLPPVPRDVDGLVEVLLDATAGHERPLDHERVHGWHAALFPTGFSGMRRIRVGEYRPQGDVMQVVSGRPGRQRIHFEAPPAERMVNDMQALFDWWRGESGGLDGLVRAGLAHLRFVTLHPFEDGNGRLARALTDMALAQDEQSGVRLYSLSAQIEAERSDYYHALERAQCGDGNVTPWLCWFLGSYARAVQRSEAELDRVLSKARFWQHHSAEPLNDRQRKVLGRLLDAGPGGFEGGITNRKYAGIAHTSRATAQRDLAKLVAAGLLVQRPSGGRSTSYDLSRHADGFDVSGRPSST